MWPLFYKLIAILRRHYRIILAASWEKIYSRIRRSREATEPNIYMLFAGWEVRIVKNCDRGLENAARGRRPRAAFSRPRSQFFTIRTDPKPVNNFFLHLHYLFFYIYLKFELLRNVERVINSCIYMTLSTFLSDSNFKFVKPLSRASNQQNKHKTTTFNIFLIFCGIFISL